MFVACGPSCFGHASINTKHVFPQGMSTTINNSLVLVLQANSKWAQGHVDFSWVKAFDVVSALWDSCGWVASSCCDYWDLVVYHCGDLHLFTIVVSTISFCLPISQPFVTNRVFWIVLLYQFIISIAGTMFILGPENIFQHVWRATAWHNRKVDRILQNWPQS